MTIQNKTARALFYAWHSGQWSDTYAAASSGLVSDWSDLYHDISSIKEHGRDDWDKLVTWLQRQQIKAQQIIASDGKTYYSLPWYKGRMI